MSRLNSMMRRLAAQADGIEWSLDHIKDVPGDVLEMGLGNGRTYDHLRELIKDRRIFVMDRAMRKRFCKSSLRTKRSFRWRITISGAATMNMIKRNQRALAQ